MARGGGCPFEGPDQVRELEAHFVAVAASYGERKGITYTAWRELGVPASVLAQARITRAT